MQDQSTLHELECHEERSRTDSYSAVLDVEYHLLVNHSAFARSCCSGIPNSFLHNCCGSCRPKGVDQKPSLPRMHL